MGDVELAAGLANIQQTAQRVEGEGRVFRQPKTRERLGHASVGITLDTYSHVLPGLQATAAGLLDGLLTPAEAEAI